MTKCTQGEWIAQRLDGSTSFHWRITSRSDPHKGIATVHAWRGQALGNISQEEADANALLIQAAPRLLQEVENALEFIQSLLLMEPDAAVDHLTNNADLVEDGLLAAIAKTKSIK